MTKEVLTLVLDKKADNARELGLDYEPENTLHWHALNYRTAPTQNAQKMFEALEKFVENSIKKALSSPNGEAQPEQRSVSEQQEPVSWKPDRSGKYLTVVYRDLIPGDEVGEVIDHPKAVIMSWSNAVHDVQQLSNTTSPQRKPLTDEEIDDLYEKHVANCWDSIEDQMGDPVRIMTRAIEAAHGIKE